ncbi:hypothetical protein [Arthrobacter woluwensis]|uniref:hypothetical protein n=1 Tax=Arthrobacter woluwensis TaxID=156980 RepID=UPI0016439297|nr:hypothetical protein [Arthrobacter woluwensis]
MLTSILRTIVPAIWGALISWALSLIPALEPLREQLLAQDAVIVPIVYAVITGAWYAFWRWLEPRLPDWLTRALLGSAKAPTYQGRHMAEPDPQDRGGPAAHAGPVYPDEEPRGGKHVAREG